MKHLSERARMAKERNKLVSPHVRLARKINRLSHPSKELLEALADLLLEYEAVASFKAKADGRRQGRQETVSPGQPVVAGFMLDVERAVARIEYKRKNNLHALRKEIQTVTVDGAYRLAAYEERSD